MKANASNTQTPVSAVQISAICQHPAYGSLLKCLQARDQLTAEKVVEPTNASPNTLIFASTPDQLKQALAGNPSILVLQEALTKLPLDFPGALYSTPSASAAMALILPLFETKKQRFESHPSAIIDPTAKIGTGVKLGAYAVVGAHAIISDNCLIGSHVVVEKGAQIGAGTILHPQSFIGADCVLGKNCEIHPHTTIGADGFGFVQSPDLKRNKIPQIGIVVLGDNVEMGANCAVDRATIGETRIGEGTKFDNLCHVAHNCKIGKHNVFAAGFFVAGSSEIGDNCMVGGQAAVADHIKVGSNMIIGGRSGVTKDLETPGAYAGFPIEPMRDAVRTLANLPNLTQLRRQVAQIRKHLGLKDEEK